MPKNRKKKKADAPTITEIRIPAGVVQNPPFEAQQPPEPVEVPAGPTAVPGFEFCSVEQVDRLLQLFAGGLLMTGAPISPAMRIAFGVHQIRIGLAEAIAPPRGGAPEENRQAQIFLLDAARQLLNQVSGVEARLLIELLSEKRDVH